MLLRFITGCVIVCSASASFEDPSFEDDFKTFGCIREDVKLEKDVYQERESYFKNWRFGCRHGWANIGWVCYKPCNQHHPANTRIPNGWGWCNQRCPHSYERVADDKGDIHCREPCSTFGFGTCGTGHDMCYDYGSSNTGRCQRPKPNNRNLPKCAEVAPQDLRNTKTHCPNLAGTWTEKNGKQWRITMFDDDANNAEGRRYEMEGIDFGWKRTASGIFQMRVDGKWAASTTWYEDGRPGATLLVTMENEKTLSLSNGDQFVKKGRRLRLI